MIFRPCFEGEIRRMRLRIPSGCTFSGAYTDQKFSLLIFMTHHHLFLVIDICPTAVSLYGEHSGALGCVYLHAVLSADGVRQKDWIGFPSYFFVLFSACVNQNLVLSLV